MNRSGLLMRSGFWILNIVSLVSVAEMLRQLQGAMVSQVEMFLALFLLIVGVFSFLGGLALMNPDRII